MTKRNGISVALVLASTALAACAPLTPHNDALFGDAVNLAAARQVVDVDARTKNAGRDAAGIDGKAAKGAIDRYYKAYVQPPAQPSVFTIGISGGGSM